MDHKIIFINKEDNTQVKQLNGYVNHYSFGVEDDTNCAVTLVNASPFVLSKFNSNNIKSQLIGDYNFNNISAAIAIGHYFKVGDVDIKAAIESYIPENNRSQIINKESNTIILDAYNANPTSMAAALDNFDKLEGKNKTVILGDMFELGQDAKYEHKNIAEHTILMNIDNVFLVGENFFGTNIESSNLQLFRTFEDLQKILAVQNITNNTILIKGSRGMALERVLELL